MNLETAFMLSNLKVLYKKKLRSTVFLGYGNLVPTNDVSKLFCIFYTLIGVPSLFLSLTNMGQFLAEAYWILLASLKKQRVGV